MCLWIVVGSILAFIITICIMYWNVVKILLIIVAIIYVLSLLVSLIKKVIKKVEHENELKLFAINEENKTEEKKQNINFKKLSNILFVSTIDLREHPLKNEKYKKRKQYFEVLMFLINNSVISEKLKDFTEGRLSMYFDCLLPELMSEKSEILNQKIEEKVFIKKLMPLFYFANVKYSYIFLSDLCLFLQEESLISYAIVVLKRYLPKFMWAKIDKKYYRIKNLSVISEKYKQIAVLIEQYKTNIEFFARKEKRVIVTALVSAGKSTLINSLIGERLTRTKSEICTSNLAYIYNKAYNDGTLHFYQNDNKKSSINQCVCFNASEDDINTYDINEKINVSASFLGVYSNWSRICLIDTPGVDAAINVEHGECTKKALLNECYDMILYVVSPNQISTDSQKEYLKWILNNLPKKKIVFVINKLDTLKPKEDSIADTIFNFYKDLCDIGFKNPTICPISSYFSFLLKQKISGKDFSEDEIDDFRFYSSRFSKPFYNLSGYYNEELEDINLEINDLLQLSKRCGLYGIEKIINEEINEKNIYKI